MRYLWNIAVLHLLGAGILAFVVYSCLFISGGQVNRTLISVIWAFVSVASFIGGIACSGESYTLFGDEFKKLKKIRITTEEK